MSMSPATHDDPKNHERPRTARRIEPKGATSTSATATAAAVAQFRTQEEEVGEKTALDISNKVFTPPDTDSSAEETEEENSNDGESKNKNAHKDKEKEKYNFKDDSGNKDMDIDKDKDKDNSQGDLSNQKRRDKARGQRTLWSRIKLGRSFVDDDFQLSPWLFASDPHGTQMANLICAIDPACELYVAKVTDGRDGITPQRVARAGTPSFHFSFLLTATAH